MRRRVGMLALGIVSVMLAGCVTTVSVVELERSDQQVDGNRGYLGGTPPPVYEEREVRPWQMIEVEVDLQKLKKRTENKQSYEEKQYKGATQ